LLRYRAQAVDGTGMPSVITPRAVAPSPLDAFAAELTSWPA
jgi:hypothetical protein